MKPLMRFSVLILALGIASGQTQKAAKTDPEIKQAIINESIARYRASRGNCPCPYNTDRAGHQCGARSAYSRPGGAAPVCYEKDAPRRWWRSTGDHTNSPRC